MKLLQLKQVGRYYYDPNRPASIPQHKIELWPGYITSIQCYEGMLDRSQKAAFKVHYHLPLPLTGKHTGVVL